LTQHVPRRPTPSVPDPGEIADARLRPLFEAIGKRTIVMGVLNVTPDSFSDGGLFADADAAVEHARRMVGDGVDIIDIGGESTRPGSDPVSPEDEIARVAPVIKRISNELDAPISIDTYKSAVAREALDNGACIVNDISGAAFDPEMPALVARRRSPVILMHMRGTPKDMQLNTDYGDVVVEVIGFLRDRITAMKRAGVDERLLMVDPGIGFAKTVSQNLEILRRLDEFAVLGRPVLVGTSRKSTIGKVLGDLSVDQRLEGTAATVAVSIANGADIIRVHDVRKMVMVARMTDAIVRGFE